MPEDDYTIFNALSDALKGNFVSDEVKAKRIAICDACEHLKHDLGVDRCGLCNCVKEFATSMPGKSCPVKKWEAENEHT